MINLVTVCWADGSKHIPIRLTIETVSNMVQLFIVRFLFRLVDYYETT